VVPWEVSKKYNLFDYLLQGTPRGVDDNGTVKRTVKCFEINGTTKRRLQLSMRFNFVPDTGDRKLGERTGLETRLVQALNYGFST